MRTVDLLVIGGGSAGMAAAIQAKRDGIDNILLVEKENYLGGILNQCIHNGFGLTEFGKELTGPEYMSIFSNQIEELKIEYLLNTQVIDLNKNKIVTCSNKDGTFEILCKAIVVATGCYERGAGAIQLPGDRCSGIITAGLSQKYANIHGYLTGKRVVILGSGDIGLIMARRLTLEGAKVLCVSEIMPYSNGLNRNISQCLDDFDIPLYLSRSVSKVIGKNRLEKVVLSKVDENLKFIPGTEMEIECDTLVLSVGLIPYIELLNNINCLTSTTKGAAVNEMMETNIDGVFSCGNCVHIHDLVDFVSEEGRLAGHGAALYIQNKLNKRESITISAGENISYVVPQSISFCINEDIAFKFRVKKPLQNKYILFESDRNVIKKVFKPFLIPSEMILINIEKELLSNIKGNIIVRLEDK